MSRGKKSGSKFGKIVRLTLFGLMLLFSIILCHGIALFFGKLTGFTTESGMFTGVIVGVLAHYMFGDEFKV